MGQLQQAGAADQVFVGGTLGVNKKELHSHFEAYGSVSSDRLAYDCAGKRRGFGQTHAQHSGSISKTAGTSLLDVLRQVPTLPESLSPDSQKALSATCKSCRLPFIAHVQIVTVLLKEDLPLVFKRRWPQLNMVILQHEGDYSDVAPSANLRRIIDLHVSARGSSQATIFILRLLHNFATDLPCTHLAAQQLAHQMRIKWPLMYKLLMYRVHDLDGLGLEIVSQVVKGTWTQLEELTLFAIGCGLKTEALLLLSQGNWPGLTCLNISRSCLDAEGMALLVKGNWPLLTSITLSFDPTMDAVAIAHLSAANWPIESLTIEHTPFSAEMAAELADLQLPNLTVLHLRASDLTAAAVSELARADWPSLGYLELSHDDLDAVAVLLGVDLDKVQALASSACDSVEVQRTVSGPGLGLWPRLNWISISKLDVRLSDMPYDIFLD